MTIELPWRGVSLNGGLHIPTSLTDAETKRLGELADGRTVLEIGSAYGYSAVAMALAGAKHVFSVDPHTMFAGPGPLIPAGSLDAMRQILIAYKVADRVTMGIGFSYDILPALRETGARYDFVFVDGDHHYDAVVRDLSLAESILNPGGMIACHDYGEIGCDEVPAAWDEFLSQHGDARPAKPIDTLVIWPQS